MRKILIVAAVAVVIVAGCLAWCFNLRESERPELNAETSVPVGSLCVVSLSGGESGNWIVSPNVTSYTDSNSKTLCFAAESAGEYIVFCSALSGGEHSALSLTITAGDGEKKHDENDNRKRKEETDIGQFLREHIPDTTCEKLKRAADGFRAAVAAIDSDVLVTDAAVFAFTGKELSPLASDQKWDAFLSELTDELKRTEKTTVADLRTVFIEIADCFESMNQSDSAGEATWETDISENQTYRRSWLRFRR